MYLAHRTFRVVVVNMFDYIALVKFYDRAYGDNELRECGQMTWNFPRCPENSSTEERITDALHAYCKRRDECLDLVTLTTLGDIYDQEQLSSLFTFAKPTET